MMGFKIPAPGLNRGLDDGAVGGIGSSLGHAESCRPAYRTEATI